ALLNYQTMVADLTGLDISNASLLDEGTAAAEAMTLARRGSKSASQVFFVSAHCHPQTIEVVRTRAEGLGIEIALGDEARGLPECFGVLLQYPHSLGGVADYRALAEAAHAQGAVVAAGRGARRRGRGRRRARRGRGRGRGPRGPRPGPRGGRGARRARGPPRPAGPAPRRAAGRARPARHRREGGAHRVLRASP